MSWCCFLTVFSSCSDTQILEALFLLLLHDQEVDLIFRVQRGLLAMFFLHLIFLRNLLEYDRLGKFDLVLALF